MCNPQILGLSLEKNLRPTVEYLDGLGVRVARTHTPSTRQAHASPACRSRAPRVTPEASTCHAGAVDRHPALLALSVSDNLEPTVAMLSDEVNSLPYLRTHLPTALAASYLPTYCIRRA